MKYLLAALLFFTVEAIAEDASAVLNRYVQVTGGVDLYHRYNGVHLFYTVKRSDQSSENVDYFHTRDGKTMTEVDAGNASRALGVRDGTAWTFSESAGVKILSGKEAARLLANSKGFDEDDWHARYSAIVALPDQVIKGKGCHHLKLTRLDGSLVERFYDVKTGLLTRQETTEFDAAGHEQPVATDYERYDTFFGIRRPVAWHVKSGSQEADVEINTVTYSANAEAGMGEIPRPVLRAIAAAQATPGGLPTPLDLIDRFIAVTGGKEKFESIRTQIVKATVTYVGENLSFPVVTFSAGIKRYSSADMPSLGKFESGDDGMTGWERSVVMGPKLRPHSAASDFMGPDPSQVLNWYKGAPGMQTVSGEEVNGAPCYLVRLDPKSPQEATACFDKKTGLLLRTAQKDEEGAAEQLYSDYRVNSGMTFAYRIDTKVGGHTAQVQLTDIAINPAIPPHTFDLPSDVKALGR